MWVDIRKKLAEFFSPEPLIWGDDLFLNYKGVNKIIKERVDKRVAEAISKIDPMELFMKQHQSIFSEQFERMEDKLDARGQLGMMMWGYQQSKDPYFKYATEWVMNTAGNEMLRLPARSNEERGEILMWGKAQISNMLLFIKEVGRLSLAYEDRLERNKGETFNKDLTVE